MVELAIAPIPGFVVDRRELERPGPSFMVDTLRELVAELAGTELVLLLGADAANAFDSWRESGVIRTLARIAVCARGMEAPRAGFDAAVQMPALELSSTAIRSRVAAGRSLVGWVPECVSDYISGLQLYRSDVG